jgi:glycosyltransferase involved in cell wall biosynthesis
VAIPNPLSFEINPDADRAYAKRNEVLIVARLNDSEKRISAALRAWQIIEQRDPDGWVIKVVGDGPNAATLRDTARALGLRRVMFLGRQDPLQHFQAAALFLMTSRVEGWGLTLTEAMQTRTVPIAFDAYAAIRDIITDGETGVIVPNGDVAALAEATLQLMNDADRRKALAANAIVACQRFRIDAIIDQWEAIL